MIPNKIHFIWFGDLNKIPNNFTTWKSFHPDYEIYLWTDGKSEFSNDDIRKLEVTKINNIYEVLSPEQTRLLNSFQDLLSKSDYARLCLLKMFGGFYVDCDIMCMNKIPDWIKFEDSVACWENEFTRLGLIANGFIGSVQNSEFISKCLCEIEKMNFCNRDSILYDKSLKGRAWEYTGPMLLTYVWRKYRISTHTNLPSKFIYPIHPSSPASRINRNTIGDHRWEYGTSELNDKNKQNRSINFNFDEDLTSYTLFNLIDKLTKEN